MSNALDVNTWVIPRELMKFAPALTSQCKHDTILAILSPL